MTGLAPTAPLLLRIVAVLAFVQFIGHATLFVRAKPTRGPQEVAVVDAMKGTAFKFAAAPRTYWDQYFGYGLEAAFVCLVEAVLFWQLSSIAMKDASLVRPIAALFLVANLGHIALVARYFAFVVPMAFDGLIATGLIWVLLVA